MTGMWTFIPKISFNKYGRRPQSLKSGFKKPGKNGMNIFRAVLITGSPGIGKTTSAHLCAKLAGLTPIELNASDARSKKLVEVRRAFSLLEYDPNSVEQNGMNINNMSLDGFLGGAHVRAYLCLSSVVSAGPVLGNKLLRRHYH